MNAIDGAPWRALMNVEGWIHKILAWIDNTPWWEYRELSADRREKLNASEVGIVRGGDAAKINRLWEEKLGLIEPEDLTKVWPVIVGQVLEAPILHWYELRSGSYVTRRGERCYHPLHDWLACTLDGWDSTLKCPVEAKAVGGREPLEVIIERYQPQLQAQMLVTGAPQAALTVSFGTSEPIVEYIEFDADYAAEILKRGEQFMQCVRLKIPPVDLPEIPGPVRPSKEYDMTGNNLWAEQATKWLETKDAHDACKDAEATLKTLTAKDSRKSWAYGVVVRRDRVGRQSVRRDS